MDKEKIEQIKEQELTSDDMRSALDKLHSFGVNSEKQELIAMVEALPTWAMNAYTDPKKFDGITPLENPTMHDRRSSLERALRVKYLRLKHRELGLSSASGWAERYNLRRGDGIKITGSFPVIVSCFQVEFTATNCPALTFDYAPDDSYQLCFSAISYRNVFDHEKGEVAEKEQVVTPVFIQVGDLDGQWNKLK